MSKLVNLTNLIVTHLNASPKNRVKGGNIMRVYEVSYHNGEDNILSEFYTSKAIANARKRQLEKEIYVPESFEDTTDVLMVYDINIIDVEISKKGIMSMLNSTFSE